MVNYNLLVNVPRGSPGKQTHFIEENKEISVVSLPINLSNNQNESVASKEHIKVAGKTFEPVGDWYLTGTGESYARCGEFVRALSCVDFGKNDKKHDRFIEMYSCHRPACPTCYESWALREAEKASDRLLQGQDLYRAGHKRVEIRHLAFSPPPERHKHIKMLIEQGHYNVYKHQSLEIIKNAGVDGGLIVSHFWRNSQEKDDILSDNENQDPYNPPNDKYDWYFSPHFHVLGTGFLQNSDEFYNKTGWIYKNLGERRSFKDTIYYLLTHCANHKNHHAVTWFGIFSYIKIVKDFEETKIVTVPCQACGNDLHEYALDYSWNKLDTLEPDWSQDLGIHQRKVKLRVYKLK